MRRRGDMTVPALVLFVMLGAWFRKIRVLATVICGIVVLAIIVVRLCAKNRQSRKNGEEKIASVNFQNVYDFLAKIPRGKVVTYGMIAEYLGDRALARTVGNILNKNPDYKKYPCYKVVSYNGKLSKGYAFGGIEKQKELLLKDNIKVKGYKVDLNVYRWDYKN